MISRIDRVQVVVAERAAAAAQFFRLLAAEPSHEDRVAALGARRTVLRLGTSAIELLEPDGSGVVDDFLRTTRGGLFAAGVATHDRGAIRARLRAQAVDFVEAGEQLLLPAAAPGLRLVVTPDTAPAPVGGVRHLYEVTNLTPDFRVGSDTLATVFGLDPAHFVPIRSAEFGYEGVLTLFHPDRLDRIEIITPHEAGKTMGRFFARRGACLYMCYAEADDLGEIRRRLLEHAPDDWTGPRNGAPLDNLFVHPKALAGMMLGVSRTTHGWTWSGHPERVVAA